MLRILDEEMEEKMTRAEKEVKDNKEAKDTKEKHGKKKKGGSFKTVVAIFLAAIIAASGASIYKMSPFDIDGTITSVTDENKDYTEFDNILALDETIGVTNLITGEIDQMQVEDAIVKMDEIAAAEKELKDLHFDKYNDLSNEEKASIMVEYESKGNKYIEEKTKQYNDADTKIEKARIAQELSVVYNYIESWKQENVRAISESILTRVIAAQTIQAYGTFEASEYSAVSIDTEHNGVIILKDAKSGATDELRVLPIVGDETLDAYNMLKEIKTNKGELNDKQLTDLLEKTGKVTKRCINKQLCIGPFGYCYNKGYEKTKTTQQ